jgi:hypothetical protein
MSSRLICGESTSILSRMAAAAVVPFPVFESATAFRAVERSWSLVHDQDGLIAAIANYHDDEGIALTIESGAPNDYGPRLKSALRRAVAFAGTETAIDQGRLTALMRRARDAKDHATNTTLQVELEEGEVFTGPAFSWERYIAGTVQIGVQPVTVSGRIDETRFKLQRRSSPLREGTGVGRVSRVRNARAGTIVVSGSARAACHSAKG